MNQSAQSSTDGRPPSLLSSQSKLLISYFRSGWAFLIPYLAAYLLYAWLKWPVNPIVSGQQSTVSSQSPWIPCLLHVYWFLHGLHLIIGVIALATWSQSTTRDPLFPGDRPGQTRPVVERLWPVVPWLLLALIFWMPGVYLEWPADPWEHLRRINEWRGLDTVTGHSSWMKSSYFIPYSLLSWATGLRQIFWLDFYYTGICLLLCWQYYRLARTCNLGKRASMGFVILQALLFGNNIFSFYRYYGISSSIYAQLGAVALARIALESATNPQLSPSSFFTLKSTDNTQPRIVCQLLLLLPACLLLILIVFNHEQAIGIAAIEIGAVVVWRLIEWRRRVLWWLIATTLVTNALFLWFYPQFAILESYRAQGILNAWYGFNIFDFMSPAGNRMLQIAGVLSVVNLAAALLLIGRNHVVGWLTILPFVVLLLPCITVPLAQALARHGGNSNIITFQRMLFSIPPYLSLACLGANLQEYLDRIIYRLRRLARPETVWHNSFIGRLRANDSLKLRKSRLAFVLVCAVTLALTVVPSSSPSYNRLWNTIAIVPNDLRLRDVFTRYEAVRLRQLNGESNIFTTQAGAALFVFYASDLIGPSSSRIIGSPVTDYVAEIMVSLGYDAFGIPPARASPTETILRDSVTKGQNLIADPMASNPSDWITFDGQPQFVTGISDLPAASTALQNPAGAICPVFTSAMIPIQILKTYQLEMTVRQLLNTRATVYLAVAWYDIEGRLLEPNVAQLQLAGNPRSWVNGTYSYFGLVSQTPPTSWSKFGISFGLGEAATIPSRAQFVRVGALLNYNATPSAVVQLTDIRLFEKAVPRIDLAIPGVTSASSPASQAAQLSTHWPPQQVMIDRTGTKEIQTAAALASAFSK